MSHATILRRSHDYALFSRHTPCAGPVGASVEADMAETEHDSAGKPSASPRGELAEIERRLAAIERAIWALARHAGVAVEPCPSCDSGTLQYKIEKADRTFGRVYGKCDTCGHTRDEPVGS